MRKKDLLSAIVETKHHVQRSKKKILKRRYWKEDITVKRSYNKIYLNLFIMLLIVSCYLCISILLWQEILWKAIENCNTINWKNISYSSCEKCFKQTVMVLCMCNLQNRTYSHVRTQLPVQCVYSTDSLWIKRCDVYL